MEKCHRQSGLVSVRSRWNPNPFGAQWTVWLSAKQSRLSHRHTHRARKARWMDGCRLRNGRKGLLGHTGAATLNCIGSLVGDIKTGIENQHLVDFRLLYRIVYNMSNESSRLGQEVFPLKQKLDDTEPAGSNWIGYKAAVNRCFHYNEKLMELMLSLLTKSRYLYWLTGL
jgi:hypothetical protein